MSKIFEAKMNVLTEAGFEVAYADPKEAHEAGYLRPWDIEATTWYATDRPWIDLGGVAKGECAYNQSTTIDRSNFRSLQRDFPGVWVVKRYSNVWTLGAFVADLSPELIDVLIGLKNEYPIYDESDLSDLENEEISESFDQYVYSDWYGSADKQWTDAADLFMSPRFGDPVPEIKEAFWEALSESDYSPEHSSLEVLWDYDEVDQLMMTALTALCHGIGGTVHVTQEGLFS